MKWRDDIPAQHDLSSLRLLGTVGEPINPEAWHVAKQIGPIAKPRQILVVPELPKTRSGKIMRRLLRDVAEKRALGDVTTLADPAVMNLISEGLATGARTRRDSSGRRRGVKIVCTVSRAAVQLSPS
jgi:hypothetical protein